MEDFLKEKLSKLNYSALLSLIKEHNIEIVMAKLLGAMGLTTPDRIYFDEAKLNCYSSSIVYFSILHEIFHYRRIKVLGKSYFETQFSNKNYDEFHNFVVKEEVLADRYGMVMYLRLNKTRFPITSTQMLHDEFNANRYKAVTKQMHELFQTNGWADYSKLYEEFIIKIS